MFNRQIEVTRENESNRKLLQKKKITEIFTFYSREKCKISVSGQTCGQVRKMGLFNPQNREEQAHCVYHKNARFHEDLRDK